MRGPTVVPDFADPDGWYGIGDVMRADDEGYLYWAGRIDGLINTGAYHVYPGEIEEALATLPEARAARVVGEPDPVWGEAVVAYVVGPQCYRNVGTFVTRGAESQQFPFHSVIQRAANFYNAAMLVGTNNAIRISALRSVGGLADSITEDMATGLALHTARNPETGRRWKSVF